MLWTRHLFQLFLRGVLSLLVSFGVCIWSAAAVAESKSEPKPKPVFESESLSTAAGENKAFVSTGASNRSTTAASAKKYVTASFRLGEQRELAGLTIEPVEVLDDSRCPVSVHCFWAGIIILKARVQAGSEVKEVLLGHSNHKAVTVSATDHTRFKAGPLMFHNYEIELASVEPERQSNDSKIDPKAYVFDIKVAERSKK